jgi:hypothetical protein
LIKDHIVANNERANKNKFKNSRMATLKKKKEVCRTPGKGSVNFQKLPNVPKVPKKG